MDAQVLLQQGRATRHFRGTDRPDRAPAYTRAMWTVRNPPHTGAKTAQVINFESWGVVCLNDGGFAVKSGQPAHWLGRHSMMLVLFISAVALLSLAFVPDLSL